MISVYHKKLPHWGVVWLAVDSEGICFLQLGGRLKTLLQFFEEEKISFKPAYNVKSLFCLIESYLEGKNQNLQFRLHFKRGTSFQHKVWKTLQKIPFGETRSYQWVAKKMGKPKACRAVGTACGTNPIPLIIPCHRVITSDQKLGGFSSGLPWKKRLLSLEENAIK